MNDQDKTKEQLLNELMILSKRVAELDGFENSHPSTMDEGMNSTAFYKHLLENVDEGIWVTDKDDRIFFVNSFMVKIAGIPKERILGAVVLRDFPEDTLKYFRSYYLKARETRNNVSYDSVAVVTPAGRMTYQSGTLVPMIKDGHFDGMICTIHDITERKCAEEALRYSQQLLKRTFDSLWDAIFVIDADTAKIAECNPAASEIFGYDIQEILGQTTEFLHVDKAALTEFRRLLYSTVEGKGYLFLPEFAMKRKDGTVFPTEHSVMPVEDEEGKRLGWVSVVRDITERKRTEEARRRLEERLRRAEKMEIMGTLAAGVAHDLNNVLGILIGYSELLLGKIPEGNPLTMYATKIFQSGKRGAAIIQDLLTLARRGVAISEVINLNTVVSGYFKTPEFEKLKEYHPYVTFKTDLEKDLLNIKGSPIHLEKTLMNLVSNAAEAISGNGEIMIRTENRYLDRSIQGYDDVQEGVYVVLTVSDDGKGISSADLEMIFEPFFTKKVMGRSGTGLGLTVVWGTVKDHCGYVDVQSEEGKGTTFVLYFPVTRNELTKDQKAISPEQYMGRGEYVLVVDDIKDQRELAVDMLNSIGYKVTSVSSGEEAVSYIKANKVDLLLLDMIMDPGIDGLETYQRVLEINPKQKAIIVSGFSETERVKKAQKLGAVSYVQKPYIMVKIGMAVRKELDKK